MRWPFETPGLVAAGAEDTPILGELEEDELGAAEFLGADGVPTDAPVKDDDAE